jgi:hypothetical protein
MIKEEYVTIKGHPRNIKHYLSKGYAIAVGKPCEVKTIDLISGTTTKITSICDYCSNETSNTFKDYFIYTEGLENPFYCQKCNSIKNKMTSIKNWGVDNPMKSDVVKNKLRESLTEKYGVSHYSNTDEYKEKYKETCKSKYGKVNTFQVDEFKEKSKEKVREKWGVDYYLQTEESKVVSKNTKEKNTHKKFSELIDEQHEIEDYTNETFKVKHLDCGNSFLMTKSLLRKRVEAKTIICYHCNPIKVSESYLEIEIRNFIKSLNVEHSIKDKSLLKGKELDILIESHKLALEINGVYWHSELFKDKGYHLSKTNECLDKKIFLMHIWEDDWLNKKDIVKSIIRNKISKIENRIWARKCQIREVTTSEEKSFLNNYHIQGWSSSQIKLGLYFDEELVSLMTFGWRWTNSKKEMELIRFCNKIDTNVVGASSKLFSYFLKRYEFDKIISYSDLSMFDGGMYSKLGFKRISLSKPNYYWVVDKVRKHRFNFCKRKLIDKGFDANKSEVRIMHERGYYRIWGCGQWRWEYIR